MCVCVCVYGCVCACEGVGVGVCGCVGVRKNVKERECEEGWGRENMEREMERQR